MKFRVLALSMLALSALPAMADTRDDVMQRAEHCVSIADGRKWLDCYYAAAQPLRAELGLAAAPQAPAYTALFASPGPAPLPRAQEDDDRGLLTELLVTSRKVPPAQFGLRNAKPGTGLNVDHITSPMSDYRVGATGFYVTLANGQEWRTLEGAGELPNWRGPAAKLTATVSQGAFNSFNLRVNDDPTLYKVQRVK